MSITILRVEDVTKKTGLPRSSIYAEKTFPKPIKLGIGRAVGWIEAEVEEWLEMQRSRRDARV